MKYNLLFTIFSSTVLLMACAGPAAKQVGSGTPGFRIRSDFAVTLNSEQGWAGELNENVTVLADQPFRIPPGRSPGQLASLLGALAGVTPVVTGPFENFLIKQVPRVAYGATLLIVTSVTNPELFETLVQLKHRGRRITLLSFAKEPPLLVPGVRTVHLPFTPPVENLH